MNNGTFRSPFRRVRTFGTSGRAGWRSRVARFLIPVLVAGGGAAGAALPGGLLNTAPAAAATGNTLDLKILLIGDGSTDPTTAAWESALTQEGVPYTEVDATGTAPDETVTLPALSDGTTGDFDGIVFADSPYDFATGQLTTLYSYEATFGVRQIDGYYSPAATLGQTIVSQGALDGTTGTLTAAGLTAFPELEGPIPFSTGTYGYASVVNAGAPPLTPLIENSTGDILAAVYQHPSTDAQANVPELALNFDYNASQLQWQLLAPGLIDWVTQDVLLGEYRNYVEMDIDDTFTPDDSWTPDTTNPLDNGSLDYNEDDSLRMQPADVVYAAQWSAENDFRLDQLFNYGSAVAAESGNLTYDGSSTAPTTYDPLVAEFQADDPATGKPYADDFGWISHTYDTPYLDVGCATQNYIEAELNENTSSIAAAPGSTAGTGGLGITESTDVNDALGYEDPQVFVPGNHSGFADLVPGNPATVDPPDLDTATTESGGSLAAGSYEYAVTDSFTAGAPVADQSAAGVTTVSLSSTGSVQLTWQAICHAAEYYIYRAESPYTSWSLVGTDSTPQYVDLPDSSSGNNTSPTDITGGGELEQTFTDNGTETTTPETFTSPPTAENAVEQPWEQNQYFIPALEAVGITTVGADASKPYPDPPTATFGTTSTSDGDIVTGATYTGTEYAAGQTFVDGTAQVVPRHPINIFYNNSTEEQAVSEYNSIYLSTADGGGCTGTDCLTTPADFADIVGSVDSGMFTNMLSNDPEPTYVHQTNIMGEPPATISATPPDTPDTTGDGLLYSVLNPLLAEYKADINYSTTPWVQLTEGAIGDVLADQSAWSTLQSASSPTVTASVTNGVVTISNSGTTAAEVPVTMPPGTEESGAAFGQSYGGTLSDWVSVPAGGSVTLNLAEPAVITSAATTSFTSGVAGSFAVATTGFPTPTLTETGSLPTGLSFTPGTGTAAGTATISGTTTDVGTFPITITATNGVGTAATQSFTLTVVAVDPAITSPNSYAFTSGVAGTFSVIASGSPTPSLTESGALPNGVTFTDNGNGTATLAGTSTAAGSYPITISATNAGSTATQSFTVSVNPVTPVITTANGTTFSVGQAGTFSFSATGSPAPSFTESGALPSGVTFTDDGNGAATLAGTPAAGTAGTYPLTITATNSGGSQSQTFTLTVTSGPSFSSAASASAIAGKPFSFTVKTAGLPTPTLSEAGALPAGLSFTANANGTATLSGTVSAKAHGIYSATFTATNSLGTVSQPFTLTVDQSPAFTGGTRFTETAGTPFSLALTTTGYPAAKLAVSKLARGLRLVMFGNGAGELSGTAKVKAGTYHATITATNAGGRRSETLTLAVKKAGKKKKERVPGFTSAGSATAKAGHAFSFKVKTSGSPTKYASNLSESGALPGGVKFKNNHNGTATLSGTPAATSGGFYVVTVTAKNGDGTTTQALVLTVTGAPAVSTSSSISASVGKALSFTVRAAAAPAAAVTVSRALPAGLRWVDHGDGTATLAGVPAKAGTYLIPITIKNALGSIVEILTVRVK
jgi:hypothetical protein